MVEVALARGHDVTLLHRGGKDEPFPDAEHLHADRDSGLDVLAGRTFDVTVDVSAYFPRQVDQVADVLGRAAGRYVVISSTSVYALPDGPGFDESSHLVEAASYDVDEITDTTYGQLKVAIEQAARARFGDRATVVRPTYVIGPYDYTDRFTYWVRRTSQGGEVLAPGDAEDPIQVIDARDMATWIVGLAENDVAGTLHAGEPASRRSPSATCSARSRPRSLPPARRLPGWTAAGCSTRARTGARSRSGARTTRGSRPTPQARPRPGRPGSRRARSRAASATPRHGRRAPRAQQPGDRP